MQKVGTGMLYSSNALGIKGGRKNKQTKVVFRFKCDKCMEMKCNANGLHL